MAAHFPNDRRRSHASTGSATFRRVRPRIAAAALLLGTMPAAWAQMIPVERSVLVHAAPEQVWRQAGSYCAIAQWDAAYKSCSVVLGDGSPGTVRRVVRKAGGAAAVDVLTDRGPYSYSYRKLSNHTRGRLQVAPGLDAGTSVVTWQMWLDPFSVPHGSAAEYPQALGDDMQAALGRIKSLAEAPVDAAPAYPVREAGAPADPATLGG